MMTFHTFETLADAVAWRLKQGHGGWIFRSDDLIVLFPSHFTPSEVMTHRFTTGLSGELY